LESVLHGVEQSEGNTLFSWIWACNIGIQTVFLCNVLVSSGARCRFWASKASLAYPERFPP
jgi:hypothetical protein